MLLYLLQLGARGNAGAWEGYSAMALLEMKQHLIMNRFCNTDVPLQQQLALAATGQVSPTRTPSGYAHGCNF
jgi:hypothetical protein